MTDVPQAGDRQRSNPGLPMRAAGPPGDDRPGRSCANCRASVAWTVKVYCRNHQSRFGGRTYCVACQRAFPAA